MADDTQQPDDRTVDDQLEGQSPAVQKWVKSNLAPDEDDPDTIAAAIKTAQSKLGGAKAAAASDPMMGGISASKSANAASPEEMDTVAAKLRARGSVPGSDAQAGAMKQGAPGSLPDSGLSSDAKQRALGLSGDQPPPAPGTPPAKVSASPEAGPDTLQSKVSAAAPAQAAGDQTASKPASAPPPTPAGKQAASAADTATKTADGPAAATASIQDKLKRDTGAVRDDMQPKLTALDNLAKQYQDAYASGKKSAQWGEVAEKMGHALAEFGAGYQGMKSGLDMTTGLKFDKTDWSNRYKDLLDELKVNLNDIRTRAGEVKEEGRERVGSLEKGADVAARGAEEEAKESNLAAIEKSKSAAETTRERERSAAEQKRTETLVAGKKDVAGTNAGAKVDAASIRNNLKAELGDKKMDTKDEQDLAGYSTYLNAVASGDRTAQKANIKYQAAGERLFPGRAAGLEKQAKDNSGLFGSGEAPTLPPRGGAAATGSAQAPASPPKGFTPLVSASDGKTYNIPDDKVDAARASGKFK